MSDSLPKLHTGDIQVTVRGAARPVQRIIDRSPYRTNENMTSAVPPERALMPRATQPVVRRGRRAGVTWHRMGKRGGYQRRGGGRVGEREPMSWRRKVMLQSLICALLLLGVWGLSQWDAPLARTANEAVRAAVTTNVDIDRALGKLKFVSDLLPEAAFVFAPQGGEPEDAAAPVVSQSFILPCTGQIARGYQSNHTGILMRGAREVVAPGAGEVVGIARADGEWSVRMKHAGGVETVTSCLKRLLVQEGDQLRTGDVIGEASSYDGEPRVYFEVLVSGKPVDPAPYLMP